MLSPFEKVLQTIKYNINSQLYSRQLFLGWVFSSVLSEMEDSFGSCRRVIGCCDAAAVAILVEGWIVSILILIFSKIHVHEIFSCLSGGN